MENEKEEGKISYSRKKSYHKIVAIKLCGSTFAKLDGTATKGHREKAPWIGKVAMSIPQPMLATTKSLYFEKYSCNI